MTILILMVAAFLLSWLPLSLLNILRLSPSPHPRPPLKYPP